MLYFIQRNACPLFLLPVLPWSISGLCLELGTEVGGTGIVQPVGYCVEGQFTVIQQFLGAFDFLGDAFVSELLPSENGLYRLQLTPADKGAVMSAVTVEVAADGTPHAVVYDLDGDTLRIDIRRIASSADVKRFDAGAYPGYETIDFR